MGDRCRTLHMSRLAASVAALSLWISACSGKGTGKAESEPQDEGAPSAAPQAGSAGGSEKAAAQTAAVAPKAVEAAAVEPLPADTGTHEGKAMWSVQLGTDDSDTARGVALAPDGAIYVAGYTKGSGLLPNTEPVRGADAWVARFSSAGKLEWGRTLGSELDDTADTIAADREGNVIIAGSFAETLAVGEGSLKSAGADDGFIAKFAPDGRRLWVKRIGGREVDAFHHVVTDSAGNIIATGVFGQTADIAGSEHETRGLDDIFLVKLSPDGQRLWSKSYGFLGKDYGRALAIDKQDNIVLLCEFSNKIDFGGGELESDGNRDIALVKLGPGGEHIWSRRFGNNLDELGVGLALDPAGNVIITGAFDDKLSMGGAEMTALGRSDIFIAKYDVNGNHLWSQRYGDNDEDIGSGVATDQFGNIYATGWFWKTATFGKTPVKSAGKRDLYLLKLSPNGEHLWSHHFGAKESDYGKSVAVTRDGNPILVGSFYFTVSFGGAPMTAKEKQGAPIPRSDVFIAEFSR